HSALRCARLFSERSTRSVSLFSTECRELSFRSRKAKTLAVWEGVPVCPFDKRLSPIDRSPPLRDFERARTWGRTFLHSLSQEASDAPISRNSATRWAFVALAGMSSSAWRRSESTFDIGTLSVCDNPVASAKCRGSTASSEGRRG